MDFNLILIYSNLYNFIQQYDIILYESDCLPLIDNGVGAQMDRAPAPVVPSGKTLEHK